jgi:hypothetical protein
MRRMEWKLSAEVRLADDGGSCARVSLDGSWDDDGHSARPEDCLGYSFGYLYRSLAASGLILVGGNPSETFAEIVDEYRTPGPTAMKQEE